MERIIMIGAMVMKMQIQTKRITKGLRNGIKNMTKIIMLYKNLENDRKCNDLEDEDAEQRNSYRLILKKY